MSEHKRRWLRRLLGTLLGLAILAGLGLAALHVWGPGLVATALEGALAPYWDGGVEVAAVRLSLEGRAELGEITLTGPDGRDWLRVEGLRVALADWPSLHPTLSAVRVRRIEVTGRFEAASPALPLRGLEKEAAEPPPGAPTEEAPPRALRYVDLREVTVETLALAATYGDGERRATPPLTARLTRDGAAYVLGVEPRDARGDTGPRAAARFDPVTSAFEASLRAAGAVPAEAVRLVAAALGRDLPVTGGGRLDVDLDASGTAADLATLRIDGRADLADWHVTRGGTRLMEEVGVKARFEGRSVAISDISGRTPGGTVEGDAGVDWAAEPVAYWADLRASGLDLAALAPLLGDVPIEEGRACVRLRVEGQGTDRLALHGRLDADAALAVPGVRRAAGTVLADLVSKPFPLPEGTVVVESGRAVGPKGDLVSGLSAKARIAGRRIKVEGFGFACPLGAASGEGHVTLPDDGPPTWAATLRLRDGRVRTLAAVGVPLGEVDQGDWEADLSLRGRGNEALAVTGTAAARLQWGRHLCVGGRAELDVTLDDMLQGKGAVPRGTVRLSDVGLADRTGRLVDAASAEVDAAGREARATFRAATPVGPVAGAALVRLPPDGPIVYEGTLTSHEPLRLGGLRPWTGPLGPIRDGRVTVDASFQGDASALPRLTASGTADLALTGPVDAAAGAYRVALSFADDPAVGAMPVRGHVTLSGWEVAAGERLIVSGFEAEADLGPNALRVASLSGRTPHGPVTGRARVALARGRPAAYEAHLEATGLDAGALVATFAPESPLETARLDVTADVTGRPGEPVDVRADGSVRAGLAFGKGLEVGGRFQADVRVDVAQGEGGTPAVRGTASLADWTVAAPDGPVLTGLGARAAFDGRTVTVTDLAGRAGDGAVAGRLTLDLPADAPPAWKGRLDLARVAVGPVAAALGGPAAVPGATLDVGVTFAGTGTEQAAANGDGRVALALEAAPLTGAESAFTFDLAARGPWTAEAVEIDGTARFDDAVLRGEAGPIAEAIGISLLFLGRGADVSSLRAKAAGGRVIGRLRTDWPAGGTLSFSGGLDVRDLRFAALFEALGRDERPEGRANLVYGFRGDRFALAALRGRGMATARDTDTFQLPVLQGILAFVGVAPEGAEDGEIRAAFETAGRVLTLRDGRVATPIVAIYAQKGGTVNLATRELDLYVVPAFFDRLGAILEQVPLVNLVTAPAQALTRLHVSGTWDAVEVRKDPVGDIGEAAWRFFQQTAETGGSLGGAALRSITDLVPK